MEKNYPTEKWKVIKFDFEFINDCRLEVSNFGRVRSFNKVTKGDLLKGSMTNGYPILRLSLFKAREKEREIEFNKAKEKIAAISKQIKILKTEKDNEPLLAELNEKLVSSKKKLSKKMADDRKSRTIYYQSLIHRLVATYFLNKPLEGQVVVAHLDYNKENNRSYNLKWMTPEENYIHQRDALAEIAARNGGTKKVSPIAKLSVTKVMLLKKLLNQNKPIKQLAKQFRVTDTQIIRIKKGENWAEIKAAE